MELLITDLLNWKNYSYSLLKSMELLITDLLNYVKLEKYSLPKYCHYPQLSGAGFEVFLISKSKLVLASSKS